MVMKYAAVIFVATLILVFAGNTDNLWATSSTHIWGPSTDIQGFKVWHITCDMYLPVKNANDGSRLPAVTNVGITVGVLPFKKFNMEIGVDHKSGLGSADDYPLYGNAKIGIPENAFGKISPAIAVGIFDIGTRKNYTDYNIVYGKLAKSWSLDKTSLGRFSVGYFMGNEKLLLNGKGNKDNHGILIAWERTIGEVSDKLWLCVEYMGTRSAYGAFNIGASWKFAPNVSLLSGYEFFNNRQFVNTATLQVDIDF